MGWNDRIDFSTLFGKTITEIKGAKTGCDEVYFTCSNGDVYKMYHSQDCCESVQIDDIVGDISDLLNTPITLSEEVQSAGDGRKDRYDESYTWTFYKLATIKGYVTIKRYGTSNGYYSESVDFELVEKWQQD